MYVISLLNLDIDDCSPNQCLNGATCIDKVNDFECNCAAGYNGNLCQTSKYP